MPDFRDGNKYSHLRLIREEHSGLRRTRAAQPGPRPDRGGRETFAPVLIETAENLIESRTSEPPPVAGIDPHLVIRIPIAENRNPEAIYRLLDEVGLTIVSIGPDRAVVVFRDEVELNEFVGAVETYKKGPRIKPRTGEKYKSTKYDILEFIEPEGIKLWGREDRIGERLAERIGADASGIDFDDLYTVDLELWHPGSTERAVNALREVELIINYEKEEGELVLDSFTGQSIIFAKVSVRGSKLSHLLDTDAVAEIDLPPIPVFYPFEASLETPRDFPTPPSPPEDGPKVCIIDSGIIANHPLLSANVGHEEAILTRTVSPADANGHGTMVAGLAVFGDVRRCYEKRDFSSTVTLFSARVLNERGRFDERRLIINQMREAIITFKSAPYNCRVFNISIGSRVPAFDGTRPKQTIWAEALDNIAREEKVVIVVSSGNKELVNTGTTEEAEAILTGYPDYLLEPEAKVNDPATAAIPITVGGVAQHSIPGRRIGAVVEDNLRPIAKVNEPSPITRAGPGLNGAIKPELVDYSGNVVFGGTGEERTLGIEAGTSVMSFNRDFVRTLFNYQIGTSFAAPRVARVAALIHDSLKKELGREPDPNLIRALVASSAVVPSEATSRLVGIDQGHAVIKVCGYGLCNEELALYSFDDAVTLIAEGEIRLDNFHIYGIPIPDCFRSAGGLREISVSLAYDPPVRRRRYDYLGVLMNIDLYRGRSLDEVFDAVRRSQQSGSARPAIEPPYKIRLNPSGSSRGGYSRKKSTLQRGVFKMARRESRDYGSEYWLVVRSERKWAPSEIESQNYAVVVKLTADTGELYNEIHLALQVKERARARVRR
ncbi:MAG: S8 family peptidase [Candidatus Zixiibacteriota bacterium]|jgi:hypothetical protein